MNNKEILFLEHSSYCEIQLNRPDKHNALNRAMRAEFRSALTRAKNYPVTLLSSSSNTFCAGMDLTEVKNTPELGEDFWQLLEAIYAHNSVFIAKVNGKALGGGLSLINACDLAIASESAEFGMPEIAYGIYPAIVGPSTQLMLNKKQVAWMVLTGQPIDANTAQDWGLVNQVVEQDSLDQCCEAIATHIAKHPAKALAAAKTMLNTVPVDADMRRMATEAGLAINRFKE